MVGELFQIKELRVMHVMEKGTSQYPQKERQTEAMKTYDETPSQTISKEEAIRRIKLNGGQYDPDSNLDAWSQLEICETVTESTAILSEQTHLQEDVAFDNGSVDGGSKRRENFVLAPDKLDAIAKLKSCNWRTPPVKIAQLLEMVFQGYDTQSGWWLAAAQRWSPKAINSVLGELIKAQTQGWRTIQNPAAYFTLLLKYHKRRKSFRKQERGSL